MTCCVRILTTETLDSSVAILLVSPDGSKILVNCGEGCQRSFLEFGQKVSTVNRVCLTHLAHDSIGGLPGMILTTADVASAAIENARAVAMKINELGNPTTNSKKHRDLQEKLPGLDIIGPTGTRQFIHSLRHFMRRDKFEIRIEEGLYCQQQTSNGRETKESKKEKLKKPRECGSFHVQSIVTFDELHRHCDSSHGDRTTNPPKRQRSEDYQFTHSESSPHSEQHQKQILSFLFSSPPILGKFLADKAKELKIPPGPLYGKLKSGKDVTFIDPSSGTERTVKSAEVVEPGMPGVVVAVLCYPSHRVLEQLQTSELISQYYPSVSKPNNDTTPKLELILHLAPADVFRSKTCQKWLKDFGNEVEHVFLETNLFMKWYQLEEENARSSESANCIGCTPFVSASMGAYCRSLLSSKIYRYSGEFSKEQSSLHDPDASVVADYDDEHSPKVMPGRPLLEYIVIPRSKKGLCDDSRSLASIDRWKVLKSDAERLVQSSGAAKLASEILQDHSITMPPQGCGELLFTGTGSALPCKHRNVSGIYLRMNNDSAILLDVGEGTVGQLLRAKQGENYCKILLGIKAIWISHPHADHHLGILRLLSERQKILNALNLEDVRHCGPLVILAPRTIESFLLDYESVDPTIVKSYSFVDCSMLTPEVRNSNSFLPKVLTSDLGIRACTAIRVTHCPHAFAVVLDGTSFGRVAYSGDCRPSMPFARFAQHADLLIHEATFEDGMEAEATVKRHSTVGEALDVAKNMQAKAVVLTHFSQRYPKIPPLPLNGDVNATKLTIHNPVDNNSTDVPILFAFDFASLTPHNLKAASLLTPALRLLYPEEQGEENEDSSNLSSPAAAALAIPGLFAQSQLL